MDSYICFGPKYWLHQIDDKPQAGRFWQSAWCRAGERCAGGDQDEESAQVLIMVMNDNDYDWGQW